MRPVVATALALATASLVVSPPGPWSPASMPPAAAWAPAQAVTANDTLTLSVSASRDYFPGSVSRPACGCASPADGHPLQLWIGLRAADGALDDAPGIDTVWVSNGTRAYADGSPPAWEAIPGSVGVRYVGGIAYAEDESLEVVVALRGLAAGQRWLAARTVVFATM